MCVQHIARIELHARPLELFVGLQHLCPEQYIDPQDAHETHPQGYYQARFHTTKVVAMPVVPALADTAPPLAPDLEAPAPVRPARPRFSQFNKLRYLSFGIIAYLLTALLWWSFLLYTKNADAFEAKAALLEIGLAAEGRITSREQLVLQPEYTDLKEEYDRQALMVLGEALVLMVSLAGGIWLVNKSYRKEVAAARQQRNFLLSITHELKSPLAGIQLALQTMRKRVLEEPMRQRLTDSALSETSRLTALVEDLLLSAKLDTSYEPNREPLDLARIGRDWIDRMAIKYPEIDFALDLEGKEFDVLADGNGINSVIGNLLENAVKYIGDGNTVKLAVCERGSDIHLEISDDGMGVVDAEKPYIFDKFYRIGNEDTRSTKGTGLGLYIVKEVVGAHGGTVEVRDNSPRGSVFAICLPFGEPT